MRKDDQDLPAGPLRIGGWLPPVTLTEPTEQDARTEIIPVQPVADPDPAGSTPPARIGRQARWRRPILGRMPGRAVVAAVGVASLITIGAFAARSGSSGPTRTPTGQQPPATIAAQPPVTPSTDAGLGRAPTPTTTASASATAAPSSASPNPVAVQASYEAESDANVMTGRTEPGERDGASNGRVVRFIGNGEDNILRVTGVTVPDTGAYTLRVRYISAEPRDAAIVVNGTAVDAPAFGVTADWETVGVVAFRVTLQAGANTIEFGNPDDWAPDIDRIDVTR